MKKTITALVALGFAATFTVANAESHSGYTARTDLMKSNGAQMKILSGMAKGETEFNAEAANAAIQTVHENAMNIPTVFEANEMAEKSTALPAIWEDWEGFTAKAEGLQTASMNMEVTDAAGIGAVMGQMGGACQACHETYRVKK